LLDELRKEGRKVNHKRVQRLVSRYELGQRAKRKRTRMKNQRPQLEQPTRANESWSMDFLSDRLENGLAYRILTMLDRHTRECLTITPNRTMTARRVVAILDRIASQRGLPISIRIDNGPEFNSHALHGWAERNGVHLDFITPGRPTENAHIESFNGTLRKECVELWWVESIADAHTILEHWQAQYNNERTHSAIRMTPSAFGRCCERVAHRAPIGRLRPDGKAENAAAFPAFPQAPPLANTIKHLTVDVP
jgi:putative transposase